MSRSIILGNGEMAVALDAHGEVRDVYYPHVGYEDHARGHYMHRVGVFVDGGMHWFDEDREWEISVSCEEEALSSTIVARHPRLAVELAFKDIVYNEKSIFLRRVTITNAGESEREIKLYFGHEFEIYKSHGADTAYFDPSAHAIVHYKGRRVFLMGAELDGEPFGDWATGRAHFQGNEGSYRDADDGALSRNPIEHGPADSIIGLYARYAQGQSRTCHYWMAAAQSITDARELDAYVHNKTPEHLLKTASDFWKAWVGASPRDFHDLNPAQAALFKRSLMHVRAHVDSGGGVIASCDSDMLQLGLDTYSYVWPRDSAYVAMALDHVGDPAIARRFFEFCRDVITQEGYLMHKYLPDKSLGSSWHPWMGVDGPQLPIQEDETAIVVWALAKHYEKTHDIEFLEDMFNPLVEKAAEFMIRYRDPDTHLPQASYNLWERKRGSSTYTASAVYGALCAAADLSKILGKETHETRYRGAAVEVRNAILSHLWDEKAGMFYNMLVSEGGKTVADATADISSAYGVFAFGVLPPDDKRLQRAWEGSVRTLSAGISSGGIARFSDDDYYRIKGPSPGNPWIVTTLWYAEYLTARAKSDAELKRVREIFDWVVRHALPSGVLSEQLNPQTGEQVCAAPLAWSHAGYIDAVLSYLDKMEHFGVISPTSSR
ncbi:MAG: glycoside hydrolase family 15 protein [Patescibacteria group bacterium]|nr:glycoside hydrolase family 15 protein [Patescibacteria group bacterium]